MLNEAAIIYTVASQSIWSRAGSSGISFLFRKLQCLALLLWPSIRAKPPQLSPGKTADRRRFIPPWSSIFAILLSVPGGACLSKGTFPVHMAAHATSCAAKGVSPLPPRASVYTRNVPPTARLYRSPYHGSPFFVNHPRPPLIATAKVLASTASPRRVRVRYLVLMGVALTARPRIPA
jgi:hypothetical protein